ncbi:MAG: glycoside hydrolase domain-containing protein [Alistipes finegoldii]
MVPANRSIRSTRPTATTTTARVRGGSTSGWCRNDVRGLISLFGSEEAFTEKLDRLFTVEGDMGEHASGDISGLIGQYAHGNEPGHHTVYLYAYAGQQWKTARMVRRILNEMYTDRPNGLAGNEDCGQMSSWLRTFGDGISYPVNPSLGIYVLGSPKFAEMTIRTGNGKKFTVKAEGNSERNIDIQSAELTQANPDPYAWLIRHMKRHS